MLLLSRLQQLSINNTSSTQPSFSTPRSETVHAESSEQKQLIDVMPSQNVFVYSRTIKKSSRFQFKDKSRTKEFGTEEIGKTPVPKKVP